MIAKKVLNDSFESMQTFITDNVLFLVGVLILGILGWLFLFSLTKLATLFFRLWDFIIGLF